MGFSVGAGPTGDFRFEPAFGVGPVIVGGRDGNAERLRRLLPRQSGKEPQLDQFRGPRILRLQLIERFTDCEQVQVGPLKLGRHVGQFHADVSPAGLDVFLKAMIELEDLPGPTADPARYVDLSYVQEAQR